MVARAFSDDASDVDIDSLSVLERAYCMTP